MTDSSSKSTSGGARIAAVIVLVLLGILVFAQSSPNPPPSVPVVDQPAEQPGKEPAKEPAKEPIDTEVGKPFLTPPPPDVSALLNGLSLGNEIEGWKVVSFNATPEKIVWIEFENNNIYFSVGIVAKGNSKTPPPIQTELYDVGYGMVRPRGTNIVQDVFTKTAEQIASRIRLREKEVPKPAVL